MKKKMVKATVSLTRHHSEDLFPDDGSDSAPEEVTFQDGKEKSLQIQKNAAEQIKAQKEAVKRKRKEMHLRNKQHKEEKRKKLEEKRLPSEILEGLEESNSEAVLNTSVQPLKKVFEDAESSDEDAIAEKDFISIHGSTVFKLKVLNDRTRKPSVPESIANFRRNALMSVRREPTRALVSKLEKQKAAQKTRCK